MSFVPHFAIGKTLFLCSVLLPARGIAADIPQVSWPKAHSARQPDAAIERQLDALLAKMTLEQKVAQIVQPEIGYLSVEQMRQYGFGSYLNGGNTAPYGQKQADAKTWLKYADEMYAASVDSSLDGSSIPTLWGTDAMHGHSNVFGATLFPHNIGLGAARDAYLIHRIGQATAKEVAATGIEWMFAPTVAVARDDRWGRTFESYAEDPEIVAAYAGPMVTGIQGENGDDFLRFYHRIATAKHFIGDGGTGNGIDRGDTVTDEQSLRDIHAAGYYKAIAAGVQSVMASFNSWNGKRVHGDHYLLTEVLKQQMGFDGFVISDWNAHKFVDGCDLEQCAAAFNAGVDVMMVPEHFEAFYHNTLRQVKEGVIPTARLDDAVRRFLRAKIRWGVFERGKPSARPESRHPEWFNAPEHRELAREAVRKSLVLLKNNNHILPISAKSRVLIAGDGADNIAKQAGGWSVSWQGTDNTNADFPNATSIYAGLRQQIEAAGGSAELSEDGRYIDKPDVAIVVIGEAPYAEWFGDIQQLEYQHADKRDLVLLQRLKQQNIPVVTVFLSGRPLWVNKELNASDAFVAAWLPGSEGQGIADVLLTDSGGAIQYDFTGKLSFSWPKYDDQYLLNINDKLYDPLFAYGFGLSYADHNAESQALAPLSEMTRAVPPHDSGEQLPLFVRNLAEGMVWALSDSSTKQQAINAPSAVSGDGESLSMQSVNLAYQEDGRKFVWQSRGANATASLKYIRAQALSPAIRDKFLQLKVRLDQAAAADVSIELMCQQTSCLRSGSILPLVSGLALGQWHTLAIPLHCDGAPNRPQVAEDALRLTTKQQFSLAVADIALVKTAAPSALVLDCGQ
ncbi:glycoside hydrolase family 3 protein [Shewanella sp. CG12_big_fil_rev_8_21_14_0_65_47_15]|uniref:glycoside hydrolase family 3 protein n=1 Tax=Shewanella sp. CG12_big_fil_rev_8_21_14_0_65_47_15 TaxID=1975537 RepID=UPI000CAEAA2C|nr:glycoside hydrolase family 3 protein [Shewanella sp. CG12_big_fil_rev_8_21_14_0_65_47_15]PIW62660.1 MAG: beta-glucosidase [Shewanella sp. CG12_big_fil_rev_8_21_14_0_65_47_15]